MDMVTPRPDLDELFAHAQEASSFLKVLSHQQRLVVLCLLLEGEKSVSDLEEVLGLRQAALSQQLARLRLDSLVDTRRDGKSIYYRIARPEVAAIINALNQAFCKR